RTASLRLFADVVFDPAQHLEELFPVELETGYVLFDVAGDLVDGDEERQLAVAEGVEQLAVVAGHAEDRLAVGDQLHRGEVVVEVGVTPQVVPGAAHPLQRHPVVEKPFHDPEGDEIPKGVETPHTGSSPGALDRRLHQPDPVPVPQLMWRAACQPGCLVGSECLFRQCFSQRLLRRRGTDRRLLPHTCFRLETTEGSVTLADPVQRRPKGLLGQIERSSEPDSGSPSDQPRRWISWASAVAETTIKVNPARATRVWLVKNATTMASPPMSPTSGRRMPIPRDRSMFLTA